MKTREPIVVGWEEWKASRAAKRALLKQHGLDAPSRRKTAYSSSDRRTLAAFGPARVPTFPAK